MVIAHLSLACLLTAAASYGVPPESLVLILGVERGKVGSESNNLNNTKDLGPMQINSIHVSELSQIMGIDMETIKNRIRDDGCFNVTVAAMLLRKHLDRDKDILLAMGSYHSRTPDIRDNYIRKIYKVAERLKIKIGGKNDVVN
ncbi:transglycosylase SLT domain-containing protein [Niveispirillum sp. SYP-B3756]|uniref:lytic transglycosylase domain-containing protein n=1 Tax=Niveispirillum sp. SYP-B3756 TaxID=2662178 RepID=UPI001290F7FC|nr:lytic transglycosylase domain-containing protein [Niveispirillum sp. SYP-B3756]MQP68218.1 transglycosylase SLT domain-containing protein [Niveispirillum sp. SYP-B3756]